jgi:hypothetical protein
LTEFSPSHVARKSGWCRECCRAWRLSPAGKKSFRKYNRSPKRKEVFRKYNQTPERKAQFQTPKYRQYQHAWRLSPAGKKSFRKYNQSSAGKELFRANARRQAMRKRKARPSWVRGELEAAITAIYRQRDELTASTGIEHCVDHVFCLKPRTVFIEGFGMAQPYSGLDVPWNLMVLTAELNGSGGKHDKDPRVFYSKREFARIIEQLNKRCR